MSSARDAPADGPPPGTEDRIGADLAWIEAQEAAEPSHRAVFRRMARNIGWLLGGRGFQGAASLGYLAFSARALGPETFGVFTLILAYAQTIANFVSFQSWQTVVRYGVAHIEAGRHDRLARLLGLCAGFDAAAALVGAGLALLLVPLVGHWLEWSAAEQGPARWFGALLLLSTSTTPSGLLRLRDRFDLLTYAEAVGPFVRLAGSFAAWLAGASLEAFLAVWAAAAVAQSLATWLAALAVTPGRIDLSAAGFREAFAENRKLLRFTTQTNLSASLGLLTQVGTIVVGAFAGPAAAGGVRLTSKFAKSIAKPVQVIARVLFPELARLIAGGDHAATVFVLRRVTLIASAVGIALVALVAVAGHALIGLVIGKAYAFAYPLLIVFAIASAIEVSGFSLEPFHNASGRAGRVLGARAIGAAAYYATLAALVSLVGPIAAPIASVVSAILVRVRLAVSAAQILRKSAPAAPPGQDGPDKAARS